MDIASLSFAIDSSQALQAIMNLDRMRGSAQQAQEQAAQLTRAFLDLNPSLKQTAQDLTLMDTTLKTAGSSIEALIGRVQTMSRELRGLNDPFDQMHRAMGQLQAAAALYGQTASSLEQFVNVSRNIGQSNTEMVDSLGRLAAALRGVTEEGRRAREVLAEYGINLEGRGVRDAAVVQRQFIEEVRRRQRDTLTMQDIETVLGPQSIASMSGILNPDYRTEFQKMEAERRRESEERTSRLREGQVELLRRQSRRRSEFQELSEEYNFAFSNYTLGLGMILDPLFGEEGLLDRMLNPVGARRERYERRRREGRPRNTEGLNVFRMISRAWEWLGSEELHLQRENIRSRYEEEVENITDRIQSLANFFSLPGTPAWRAMTRNIQATFGFYEPEIPESMPEGERLVAFGSATERMRRNMDPAARALVQQMLPWARRMGLTAAQLSDEQVEQMTPGEFLERLPRRMADRITERIDAIRRRVDFERITAAQFGEENLRNVEQTLPGGVYEIMAALAHSRAVQETLQNPLQGTTDSRLYARVAMAQNRQADRVAEIMARVTDERDAAVMLRDAGASGGYLAGREQAVVAAVRTMVADAAGIADEPLRQRALEGIERVRSVLRAALDMARDMAQETVSARADANLSAMRSNTDSIIGARSGREIRVLERIAELGQALIPPQDLETLTGEQRVQLARSRYSTDAEFRRRIDEQIAEEERRRLAMSRLTFELEMRDAARGRSADFEINRIERREAIVDRLRTQGQTEEEIQRALRLHDERELTRALRETADALRVLQNSAAQTGAAINAMQQAMGVNAPPLTTARTLPAQFERPEITQPEPYPDAVPPSPAQHPQANQPLPTARPRLVIRPQDIWDPGMVTAPNIPVTPTPPNRPSNPNQRIVPRNPYRRIPGGFYGPDPLDLPDADMNFAPVQESDDRLGWGPVLDILLRPFAMLANALVPRAAAATLAETTRLADTRVADQVLPQVAQQAQIIVPELPTPAPIPQVVPVPQVVSPVPDGRPLPRGLRNNNPLNLRFANQAGAIGADPQGFAIFADLAAGIEAARRNIAAYQTRHGIRTIRGLITRWAPPSENDTDAYIRRVAGALQIGPDDEIDLTDPYIQDRLIPVMGQHELGIPGWTHLGVAGQPGRAPVVLTEQYAPGWRTGVVMPPAANVRGVFQYAERVAGANIAAERESAREVERQRTGRLPSEEWEIGWNQNRARQLILEGLRQQYSQGIAERRIDFVYEPGLTPYERRLRESVSVSDMERIGRYIEMARAEGLSAEERRALIQIAERQLQHGVGALMLREAIQRTLRLEEEQRETRRVEQEFRRENWYRNPDDVNVEAAYQMEYRRGIREYNLPEEQARERARSVSEEIRRNIELRDLERMRAGFESMAQAGINAFEQIILRGGNLRQILASLTAQLAAMAFQMATMGLARQAVGWLGGMFNGWLGGGASGPSAISGTSASAAGAIAEGGEIQPFSAGGVVDVPTFFTMPSGRKGLIGEGNEPEAIIPLRRGAQGDYLVPVLDREGGRVVRTLRIGRGHDGKLATVDPSASQVYPANTLPIQQFSAGGVVSTGVISGIPETLRPHGGAAFFNAAMPSRVINQQVNINFSSGRPSQGLSAQNDSGLSQEAMRQIAAEVRKSIRAANEEALADNMRVGGMLNPLFN